LWYQRWSGLSWHPLVGICGASDEVVHDGIHWLAFTVPVMNWFIVRVIGWHLWCQWLTGPWWDPLIAFVVPMMNWFIVGFTSGHLICACFHHIYSRNLKNVTEGTFKQCLCVMARKPMLLGMPSGRISGFRNHWNTWRQTSRVIDVCTKVHQDVWESDSIAWHIISLSTRWK
jgi:hypothetical protein